MKDIIDRLTKLEALVKKQDVLLKKLLPVEPPPLVNDEITLKIRNTIVNVDHVLLNRDLIRSDDLAIIMASQHADRCLTGFDPQNESQLKRQARFIAKHMSRIHDFKSTVMTSYYTPEDKADLSVGTRRFNQSVWIIRNHKRYDDLTSTQLCNEYKAQRDRVNIEYRNRCKELGWKKEDYPDYPWRFPTDQGPKVPTDKPSFM